MENHTPFKNTPAEFTMIVIEGGTFDMGSDDNEAYDDEKPVHKVTLSDYWLGEYPVTQAVWAYVMQDTDMQDPSNFKGENRPVEKVSWDDIVEHFLPKLNALTEGVRPEGTEYRLPTEAQWEYAAKGGKYWKTYPFKYSGSDKMNEVGWYDVNSHNETKPVGLKTPNLLGLYDMSGNVWEWCEDQWHSSYDDAPKNGFAWKDKEISSGHIQRGGGFLRNIVYCRSSRRGHDPKTLRGKVIGFRLALFSSLV